MNPQSKGQWRLFFGFVGLIMAVSQLIWIIDGYWLRGTGLAWAIRTLGPFAILYLALGAWGVWSGLVRQKQASINRGRIILIPLLIALVLSPALYILAMMTSYLGGELVTRLTQPVKIVREARSPNGRWRAFVIDKPTLDGPDHRLMLEEAGNRKPRELARLMVDVDSNRHITWSPDSDTVVFTNHYDLFAYRVAGGQSAVAPLGGRKVTRTNGTFNIQGKPAEVTTLTFPAPGVVQYKLQDTTATLTLAPEVWHRRPDSTLVNLR